MDQTRSTGDSPTIRKRALARKLVEHRQLRGLTTTDVQRRLGWSATKLNWIEKARWTESVTDSVTDLCELYEIGGPERDALITLARQSRERGWWTKYNDVFGREELPGWEAGASHIWTFETAFIPGLLQTSDYIELITRAAGSTSPDLIRQFTEDSRTDDKRSTLGVLAVPDGDAAGQASDFDAVAAAAGGSGALTPGDC